MKPGTEAEAQAWAERLGGTLLPTGSVRVTAHGRIEDLPGFADGAWWVQDAAAALVVRLAGDVAGRTVADLCAAPGGKTAQLAAAGAQVTAVDVSAARLARLRDNLTRLRLQADVVEADAATWSPGRTFDIVILDAPCSATGTIRRHPDILRLKRAEDIARMADLQRAMLANAAGLVAPGGLLVYATCSLEPEEGERQIAAFLARTARNSSARRSIPPRSVRDSAWFTPLGELRTLPFHCRCRAWTASTPPACAAPVELQPPVFPQQFSGAALCRLPRQAKRSGWMMPDRTTHSPPVHRSARPSWPRAVRPAVLSPGCAARRCCAGGIARRRPRSC